VTAPGFKPYTMQVKVKDSTVVLLEFAHGVLASVTSNFAAGGHVPDRFEMYGTEGTLTMPYKGFHVNIQSNLPPHNKPERLHRLNIRGKDGGKAFKGVNWGPIAAGHLKKAMEMGAEPLIGRDFSLHIIEIIAAAMKSAKTGEAQTLTTKFKRHKAWGV
ncbi:MAG: Gfo/Idh/MocA family protein, partial [Planctomycetota bacterium]|jgi:predicted dehydrogenase